MTTRVLLADDHAMMCDGLKALIEKEFDVVGSASNGADAVKLAQKLSPHVIIMDISMPDLNGIEATRQILRNGSTAKIVALSVHSDPRYVTEMLRAGAAGYLVKKSAAEELMQAIRTVLDGRIYLSPDIAGGLVDSFVRSPAAQAAPKETDAFSHLTNREREVLQCLSEGRSTKEIADALHVSTKTVETHRRNIMQKLDLHNVAALTKYAIRQGITTAE
jgi:DNA-binding NarL/FixJ family response regulator